MEKKELNGYKIGDRITFKTNDFFFIKNEIRTGIIDQISIEDDWFDIWIDVHDDDSSSTLEYCKKSTWCILSEEVINEQYSIIEIENNLTKLENKLK